MGSLYRIAFLLCLFCGLVRGAAPADPLQLRGRPESLNIERTMTIDGEAQRRGGRVALTCSFTLPQRPAMIGCHRMTVEEIAFDSGEVLRPRRVVLQRTRFHEHMIRQGRFQVTVQIDHLPANATRITRIRGSGRAMVEDGAERLVRLAPIGKWLGKRVGVADIDGVVLHPITIDGKRVTVAYSRAANAALAAIAYADAAGRAIPSGGYSSHGDGDGWIKREQRLRRTLPADGGMTFRFHAPTGSRAFTFVVENVPVAYQSVEPVPTPIARVVPPRGGGGRLLRALGDAVESVWEGDAAPADAQITTKPATRAGSGSQQGRAAQVVPVQEDAAEDAAEEADAQTPPRADDF